MTVETIPALSDNYMFLMMDEDGAAIVDPADARPVLNALEKSGSRLDRILITHNHFDHTAGCGDLKAATGCSIAGPAYAGLNLLDEPLEEGDCVSVGSMRFSVLSTPGHTPGHISFYSEEESSVWCGDVLFSGGCGRIMGSDAQTLCRSVQRIGALPADTKIYSGHEYTVNNLEFALSLEPDNEAIAERLASVREQLEQGRPSVPSTVDIETRTNPFLRLDALKAVLGMAGADDAAVFAEVRSRKDRW
jgi:hydroxyacylglutathione hydrolase